MDNKLMTKEEIEWCERAVQRGFGIEQIEKMLIEGNVSGNRIEKMLKYSRSLLEGQSSVEEKEIFKGKVMQFMKEPSELTRKERKEVKRWLKEISKMNEIMKKVSEKIKTEIQKNGNKDLQLVEKSRGELIEVILGSTEILDISDPITKEPVTRSSLSEMKTEDLITLLESGSKDINDFLGGKY